MTKLLLLHFYDDGDGVVVNVIGTFDDIDAAKTYLNEVTHPDNGLPMFPRYELEYSTHYWYRDAADYVQGVDIEHNPTPAPFTRDRTGFDPQGLFIPEGWNPIHPCLEVGDWGEEDEDE